MQKKTIPYKDRIIIKEIAGQDQLCIPTGIQAGNKSIITLREARSKASLLVRPNNIIDKWFFSGITLIENEYYIYGPAFRGLTLEEVLDLDPESGLNYIRQLIAAILLLRSREYDFFDFQTDSVYFLDDGTILFLQPELMDKITQSRSETYQLYAHEMINHPYLHSGEACKSFTIAILLYKILTGEFPFTANNVLDLRNNVRILDVIEPSLANPELKPAISEIIMKAFREPDLFKLEDWQQYCQEWLDSGLRRQITAAEKELISEQAHEAKIKADKQTRRKIFLEKRGKSILLTTIIVAVLGLLVGSIVSSFFKPRVTRGFSPQQIVETFYNSMNTFEHLKMEDCVTRKAAGSEIDEVMNVFLQSRMSMAYERKSYIIPADVWDKNGRPVLNYPFWVFGITNLELAEAVDSPEPVFIATYEKWNRIYKNVNPDQQLTGVVYGGAKLTDRLTLTKDKDDWVIYKYERIDASSLESEE